MGVSVIDILILGVLGFSGWRGFTKGALIESFSFATLIVGIYLASRISDGTANALSDRAEGKDFSYLPVIMFSVLFGGLLYLSTIVKSTVGKQVADLEKNKTSQILGAVFGVLHTLLIVGVVTVMLKAADYNFKVIPKREHQYSFLFKPVGYMMTSLFPALDYVGEVDEEKVKDDLKEKDQTKKVIDK